MSDREQMEFDVVIVGAGPSGLSSAIKIKQLSQQIGTDISVCIIEKGSEVGAHILSGAVMDPKAISELFPNFLEEGAPLNVQVKEDQFVFLGEKSHLKLPNWLLPKCFHNKGNFIISLGNVCRWLASKAEELGVEIYPGFAAAEVLFNDKGAVRGVATGDMGVGKDGQHTDGYQQGIEIIGKYTFFGEGCRGHLGKQLISNFKLDAAASPQVYGIGLKELWEVDEQIHQEGLVIHTAGWPLQNDVYGGSYLYHLDKNQVAVGYVVGLGYKNPYLSPFEEFQRYKTHPFIKKFFNRGKRISYGARAITAGGLQSLPQLTFPGGCLIGDNAGFLNASRIKGSHCAIKSGMLAAQAAVEALSQERQLDELNEYTTLYKNSWLYDELYRARNFKPLMTKGLKTGSIMVGIDQLVFRGKAPWTLQHKKPDHQSFTEKNQCNKIIYPKPDGKITFDRLSSVFLSNTNHTENQPGHLILGDLDTPVKVNLDLYDCPEQRYCPAGVYELINQKGEEPRLQINAQNCVHCKTCDIKDPTQNIKWVAPEGGGGPNYPNM